MVDSTVSNSSDRVRPKPDDRAITKAAVKNLAVAIADGTIRPQRWELDALALICDHQQLPIEAARVRRWLTFRTSRR